MVLIVLQRQSDPRCKFPMQRSDSAVTSMLATYLCGMIDLERSLTLGVKVPVALHLVEFTDNDLPTARKSAFLPPKGR